MATRLYPYQNEKNKNRQSKKFQIDCQERVSPFTKDWLELSRMFPHDSEDYKVFVGLLDKRSHIVAKIGPKYLNEEYAVGLKLEELGLPTFMAFHCIFNCLDDFSKMNTMTKDVCKKTGDSVSVLIMPYLNEGRIDQWSHWKRDNFDVLKNVLKHLCMSLLYAAHKLGYAHKDLHLGNILLKKTQKKKISYGELGSLEVFGIIPVIMDYEDSVFHIHNKKAVYEDIRRSINLMGDQNVQYGTDSIRYILTSCFDSNIEINIDTCDTLCNEIDKLRIMTVLSERPPTPNWLKPTKI
jgi:serine/threonine protein kinase